MPTVIVAKLKSSGKSFGFISGVMEVWRRVGQQMRKTFELIAICTGKVTAYIYNVFQVFDHWLEDFKSNIMNNKLKTYSNDY